MSVFVCMCVWVEPTPSGSLSTPLPVGGQMGVIMLFLPPTGAAASSGKLASHLCVIG